MRMNMRRIGITVGDPAGIGPEIALKALAEIVARDGAASLMPTVYGARAPMADAAAALAADIAFVAPLRSHLWLRNLDGLHQRLLTFQPQDAYSVRYPAACDFTTGREAKKLDPGFRRPVLTTINDEAEAAGFALGCKLEKIHLIPIDC